MNIINHKTNFDDLQNFEIQLFRNIISQLCGLGLFRTHTLLTSMIKDFVFHGTMRPSTIKEIEEKSPWKWDQTIKYLTILEENGFLSFDRNSDRFKTCKIILAEENKSSAEIQRLLAYYTNYFKKENVTQETIEVIISHLYSFLEKKAEFKEAKKMVDKHKLQPISNEEQNQFIDDIIACYNQEPANEIISITKLLTKNPYFMKGLSKGDK